MHTLPVESSVDDVDPGSSGRHPDVVQFGTNANPPENSIVYGLAATNVISQGIYLCGSDWAMVNVLIQEVGGTMDWKIDGAPMQHMLLWHITTVGQPFTWRNGAQTAQAKGISMKNSSSASMSIGPSSIGDPTDAATLLAAMETDNNHFADVSCYGCLTMGTHATTGAPGYTDPANADFHPAAGSPLLNRVQSLVVPADLENVPLATDGTAATGALRPHR